jgi:hypothetical protein
MNVPVWLKEGSFMKKYIISVILLIPFFFSSCYNDLHDDVHKIFKAHCYGTLLAAQNQSKENPQSMDYAIAYCAYLIN